MVTAEQDRGRRLVAKERRACVLWAFEQPVKTGRMAVLMSAERVAQGAGLQPGDTVATILQRCQESLYSAVKDGGNRVYRHNGNQLQGCEESEGMELPLANSAAGGSKNR